MNEAELFAIHGVSAFAMSEKCACCGDPWGRHAGTACVRGGGSFKRASKLSSLTEPNCAEQEELWAAKCQPAHVSHVEPEREALPHFNERTPFDPFRAFLTDPETGEVAQVEYMGDVGFTKPEQGPLQRFNDGTDALHGSAFLRG